MTRHHPNASGKRLAALNLRLRRLPGMEAAGLDGSLRRIGRNDDPARSRVRFDELQASRRCALVKQSLSVTEDNREDEYRELVDQIAPPHGLQEIAGPLDHQIGAFAVLEPLQSGNRIAFQRLAVVPGKLRASARGDVFCNAVEGCGDRVIRIGYVRPMGCEDVVRLAAEQEIIGVCENLPHDRAERRVEIGKRPSPQRKASGRILLWTTWRLHDPVEAY